MPWIGGRWPPILYTDIGWQNYKAWCEVGGFDNVTFKQNGRTMKLLTKLAIENLLHVLWGGEILSKEFKQKGERIIRNRLHLEKPESLRDCKEAMKKWGKKIYTIVNQMDQPRVVFIEHPIEADEDWVLSDEMPKPDSKTAKATPTNPTSATNATGASIA